MGLTGPSKRRLPSPGHAFIRLGTALYRRATITPTARRDQAGQFPHASRQTKPCSQPLPKRFHGGRVGACFYVT
jgi:hypothetical protein